MEVNEHIPYKYIARSHDVTLYSKVSDDADDITLMQFGTAVGQLKFRGTSLLLRLPASPVGKSYHQKKKLAEGNKPQTVPEDIPSKKQKQAVRMKHYVAIFATYSKDVDILQLCCDAS